MIDTYSDLPRKSSVSSVKLRNVRVSFEQLLTLQIFFFDLTTFDLDKSSEKSRKNRQKRHY